MVHNTKYTNVEENLMNKQNAKQNANCKINRQQGINLVQF